MNERQQKVRQLLQEKRLVKAITGIDNVNQNRVKQMVQAATKAAVGAIDVAALSDIVLLSRELTDLPLFASSITPETLAQAVTLGADVAELGNFDALYKNGFYLTAEDVLSLTKATLVLLPQEALTSITVPGHLSLEAQICLAQQLEDLGVTMLQTEGTSRVVSVSRQVSILPPEEKIKRTLENTLILSQAVNIPVMTASGVTAENVTEAFACGAAAVGVGSAFNQLDKPAQMVEVLTQLCENVRLWTQPQQQRPSLQLVNAR